MTERATNPVAAHVEALARETGMAAASVAATARLLAEGATVPFIARYRKETTGSLDEVQIQTVRDRMQQMAELDARRAAILKSLAERELLTPELKRKVEAAATMTALEDVFAPYRPKRQTRATKAKERGLEPLAEWLLANQNADPVAAAGKFVDASKDVPTADEALAGARDIIAERVADDTELRGRTRGLYEREAVVSSKVMARKKDDSEAAKYRDYFDWSEPLRAMPSHRILAIRRGEQERFLVMHITVPLERVTSQAVPEWVTGKGRAADEVYHAVEDGCKRLLMASMESEMRVAAKKAADETAIRVFADNLRELLLASPLGRSRVLAIDPAFRTGCKTVVLDDKGTLVYHTVLHATAGSERQAREGAAEALRLIEKFRIEAIAIGNGTASRETEAFVRSLKLPSTIQVVMVNESGASVYSASEAAREEFPDQDVTVRGAVSIGRRLMDPLAELVKLDPKVIGVGQYQHDVDQRLLKAGLDDVVESCVNGVGVELNTASKQLLSYVSGLTPVLAGNIVAWRDEHGAFPSRAALKKVPRLGAKAFEQAAGFLRIRGGANPLDASAVHPERYALVKRIAADLGCSVEALMRDESLRNRIDQQRYVDDEVGLPTLRDILAELARPGRDPRQAFEAFSFDERVTTTADLSAGMKLPGVVTNVTAFGAFVDVGVHQDGLVHISQLADQFVRDPNEVVKVGQRVQVTILEVDLARNRIGLSMKSAPDAQSRPAGEERRKPPRGEKGPKPRGNPAGSSGGGDDWFSQAVKKGRKK